MLCAVRSRDFKETNFQVLNALLAAVETAVQRAQPAFPLTCAHSAVPNLVGRFGDSKVGESRVAHDEFPLISPPPLLLSFHSSRRRLTRC